MRTKYIVELEDGEHLYKTTINALGNPVMRSAEKVPYYEPDFEQVKMKAYSDGYDAGLDDIWKAVRKLQEMDIDTLHEIFGWVAGKKDVFMEYTAEKVIEKLRAYEQEQDEKRKTNYYFDMMKDAIETSAKEYGMSLDEVAAVLDKMREAAAARTAKGRDNP